MIFVVQRAIFAPVREIIMRNTKADRKAPRKKRKTTPENKKSTEQEEEHSMTSSGKLKDLFDSVLERTKEIGEKYSKETKTDSQANS